ncbi:MAG: hypothetical protein IPO40_04735 [Fibrobacteres bacterium]|nr:hypothetical protein [Fibrobacterota bacterium]
MRRFLFAVAFVGLFSLTGCGLRAERTNLRHCTFAPVSWKPLASVGDTLRFAVGVEIGNPTGQPAALDSFRLLASARKPLAILSHGGTRKVAPGGKDTVEVCLAITQSSIASTAMQLVFSPPDSLTIDGNAWTPGLLWGWNQHAVRTRFDLAPHMDQLRALLGKAIKP